MLIRLISKYDLWLKFFLILLGLYLNLTHKFDKFFAAIDTKKNLWLRLTNDFMQKLHNAREFRSV